MNPPSTDTPEAQGSDELEGILFRVRNAEDRAAQEIRAGNEGWMEHRSSYANIIVENCKRELLSLISKREAELLDRLETAKTATFIAPMHGIPVSAIDAERSKLKGGKKDDGTINT